MSSGGGTSSGFGFGVFFLAYNRIMFSLQEMWNLVFWAPIGTWLPPFSLSSLSTYMVNFFLFLHLFFIMTSGGLHTYFQNPAMSFFKLSKENH